MVSLLLLVLVAVAAVLGPYLLPATDANVSQASFLPPSQVHPFGTDLNGRDLLYRVLLGAQISLLVGIAGAAVSFAIGTTYVDPILRANMIAHGFQSLVGYSKIFILVACLGFTEWLTMARIIRGQVLSLKSQEFVMAARSVGQSHWNIIWQHLLPNLVGVAIVYLTLTVPSVILDESFLSFLGVGIQAPLASWGLLLSDAAQVINPIKGYWWLLVFPAVAMGSTLLALNFLGDGLRDAFDPRQRK